MSQQDAGAYFGRLFGLEGRTALVTGGAAGLGADIAEALARAGARVLIASRNGDACAEAADRLNGLRLAGSAEGFTGDVSTEAGVAMLREAVADRCERLSILINNAGVNAGAPFESFPYADWERVFSVNVAGLFALSQALTPLLAAAAAPDDPARVVNLGSLAGHMPMSGRSYSYGASKAAVHHLTRVLAQELGPRHIAVNAIAPGAFESPMTAYALGSEARRRQVHANIPFGRLGRGDDLAGAVLYLCGRAGAYVTGAVIPIDGGVGVASPDIWGVRAPPSAP